MSAKKSKKTVKKNYIILVIVGAILVISIFLFRPLAYGDTCDFVGGWGRGKTQACVCFGEKRVLEDNLPLDGNYHTQCNGIGIQYPPAIQITPHLPQVFFNNLK